MGSTRLAPTRPDTVLDEALAAMSEHATSASAFIACNDETSFFAEPGIPGVVAFRVRGRTVLQFCAPFAPPAARAELSEAFLAAVREERHKLVVVQLGPADAADHARRGFTVNQFGTSYGIDLAAFTSRGKALAKIRQNIARARRDGVEVTEVPADTDDAELAAVDAEWLRAKGWHVKKLDFMVGERGGRGGAHRRLFVARVEGRVVGYISYSPAFGARPGWLYDLTRRRPTAPVGTIELLNFTALTAFQEEGAAWLHLGLTPFADIDAAHVVDGAASPVLTRVVDLVATRGSFVYPAQTQRKFKLKWAPHLVEPEYLAFDGRLTPGPVWQLLRATNSL